jgi:hypothetical protein
MPRFYFEISDGVCIPDEEGHELPNLADARFEAMRSARSIMRDDVARGILSLKDSVRILDARRRQVAVVRFRDALEIEE